MYLAMFAFLVLQGFVNLSSGGDLAMAVCPIKNLPQASDLGRKMIYSPEHLDIVCMTAIIELNH
jgi:hypothetical protein